MNKSLKGESQVTKQLFFKPRSDNKSRCIGLQALKAVTRQCHRSRCNLTTYSAKNLKKKKKKILKRCNLTAYKSLKHNVLPQQNAREIN